MHLEQVKTRARISGYGSDRYMQLKDEHGNVWTGAVESGPNDEIQCRLKTGCT